MSEREAHDCPHPPEHRREGRRRLGDREVRVEECTLCGQVLVHPEDAERVLSERGPVDIPPMDAKEVVMALLGVHPERPVYNRIVLMKEAFLFEKELAREMQVPVTSLRFVPYKYGPYSKMVDDALRDMEVRGLVRIDRVSAGQKEVIELTEAGAEEARTALERLTEEQRHRLERKRKAWDQLGYRGLLEKVYEEYPAYRTRSEIADKVKPRRRWT